MDIRLRPEIEELIKQDVQRGPYQTVNELVERAVSMLHEQEAWLAENAPEINAKIAEGYAAAPTGRIDRRRRGAFAHERTQAYAAV